MACLRRRCTAASTPAWSATNAWPSSVVQPISMHIMSIVCGNCTSARIGGVKPIFAAASSSALPFEALVGDEPVARVEHFLRIGRGDQHLRQHRIGIERDRREQFLERFGGPRGVGDVGRADREWGLAPALPEQLRVSQRAGLSSWLRALPSSRNRRAPLRRRMRERSPANGDPGRESSSGPPPHRRGSFLSTHASQPPLRGSSHVYFRTPRIATGL